MKLSLEKKGFGVLDIISSGQELITSALNIYPSLIITDIALKGEIDGIETISRIASITKIPYIFIADSTDQISLIDSYYLSPVKVLTKPINSDEIYFFVNDTIGFANNNQHSNYYLG
jgi:DNA-binding response OmpR family regulator